MDNFKNTIEIRSIKNGDWYWIQKSIIQEYAPKVKSTGIAVYNFLASLVDSKQSCFPSQKYIAEHLGYSRTTINQVIRVLENNGLIKVEKRSRYYCIYHLLKIRCKANKTQMLNKQNSDVSPVDTNDNTIKRISSNNDIDIKNFSFSNKQFKPQTKEELLALDLATALNDLKGLALYISYSKKYPEHLLRSIASEVKAIPDNKIKKGRGALFNYLVKKYVKEKFNSHRD